MGTSGTGPEAVRATAQGLATRLKTDPTFRARVEADPTATLTEAGMPAPAVEDFVREWAAGAEVGGYQMPQCSDTCTMTCLVTYFL